MAEEAPAIEEWASGGHADSVEHPQLVGQTIVFRGLSSAQLVGQTIAFRGLSAARKARMLTDDKKRSSVPPGVCLSEQYWD
jgi:hypothetical protein